MFLLKYTLQRRPIRNITGQDIRKRITKRISSVKNVERKGTLLIAAIIKLVGHRKELRRTGSAAAAVAVAVVKVFTAEIRQRQDKK
jgi:hypothetical protein